jgi:hypothetical protein
VNNCGEQAKNKASFTNLLETVLKAETDSRSERSRQMLAKLAGVPAVKAFDFGAPEALIIKLARLAITSGARRTWRSSAHPGSVRDHLATALGIEASASKYREVSPADPALSLCAQIIPV